jgi:phenylacetyl-CoA:acceptor oxidoreductase
MPSLNQVAGMSLELTDATGSGADLVPVAVRRCQEPAVVPALDRRIAAGSWA